MKSPEFYNGALRISTQKFLVNRRIKCLFPFLLAGASLILGSSIYLFGRGTSNFLYQIAVYAGFRTEVDYLREFVPALPSWLVYSLPDGLWMFSFSILILLIWDFKRTPEAITWIILALAIGIFLEVFQVFAMLGGRFDWRDLAFIFFAAVLPLSLTHYKRLTQ